MTESLSINIPSLSDLEPRLRTDRYIGNILRVVGPPTSKGKLTADGFVRLAERTLAEYEKARLALRAFEEPTHELTQYLSAQDHLETCVQLLHRALNYLDRIRLMNFRTPDGTPFIPRPRDEEILSSRTRDTIRELRDAIEHMDSDILEGRFADSADPALHAGRDRATLHEHVVQYVDLARWIRTVYEYAAKLSRFTISFGPPKDVQVDTADA